MILAAIFDFVEEAKNCRKKLQGKSPRANMHLANIQEIIRVGLYSYITKY